MRFYSLLIGICALLFCLSYIDQKRAYNRGCADAMREIYIKLNLTKIDEASLQTYCETNWSKQ